MAVTEVDCVTFRIPGSEWALNKAKQNVLRHYLLVGVTEELEDFIVVLETVLPRFFKGGSQLYKSGMFCWLCVCLRESLTPSNYSLTPGHGLPVITNDTKHTFK